MLGSLSRIDPKKAAIAVATFFSLPINMIPVDESVIHEAAGIMVDSGVSYDAIHALACVQKV